jgi:hypothetical protein
VWHVQQVWSGDVWSSTAALRVGEPRQQAAKQIAAVETRKTYL